MEHKDLVVGKGVSKLEKFRLAEDETEQELLERIDRGTAIPYETRYAENIWLTVGWTEILKVITGNSTSLWNNANTTIGVGNDSTAAAAGQTTLIGASTAYKAMTSGYPTTPASGTVSFRSVFLTTEANFHWQEAVIKNSVSGVCWNRLVQDDGTKTSSDVWAYTFTVGKA